MERSLNDAMIRFDLARNSTENLCQPLELEDYCIQTMTEVSPPKWHLAHTTWFFEEFLLSILDNFNTQNRNNYRFLFNSYYEAVGPRIPKSKRGILSRPTVSEILDYRAKINRKVHELFSDPKLPLETLDQIVSVLELGIQHEMQHQELLLADVLHIFWSNPIRPIYSKLFKQGVVHPEPTEDWIEVKSGLYSIGLDSNQSAFTYDNENPRHLFHLQDFKLKKRLVTSGEYLEFMNSGGYSRPEYWLSDGWTHVLENKWDAPLYWEFIHNQWWQMTLAGMKPVDEDAPVAHISYYEASAFARWAGYRLPTEFEWEVAVSLDLALSQTPHFLWQWTSSPYLPYPNYRPREGVLGEYNQKFMCNQLVLRGGSFATPPGHTRPTYRNFFFPNTRWQFSGIRLAL